MYWDLEYFTIINIFIFNISLIFRENTKRSLLFQKPAVNLFNNSEIMSQNEKCVTLYNSENHNTNDINEIKERWV